ncbi:MAG: DUF2027 domain-containing protein [Bacteroidales bacterium]|nr:DUF2027 domain-containing protein [Bacteroidales bacterium]
MKFKVGDKVKFLNEQGGGVITKIINSKMVNIAIEDGFEIPTLINELIKIDEGNAMDNINVDKSITEKISNIENNNEEYNNRIIPLVKLNSEINTPSGIYLALVPQDQKWLITGLLDIFLINHTEYDILFSLFLKDSNTGEYTGTDYDAIQPESKILLNTITREEIEKWSEGVIQILFHKNENKELLLPLNSTFKIKPFKLYKENNYNYSALAEDKAFIVSINKLEDHKNISRNNSDITAKKFEKNQATIEKAKAIKPKSLIDKHKIAPWEAEVDLHISALIEDYSGLSNSEILKYQVNYFTRCLESALKYDYNKVTFIHGIGNGILKTTIKAILKDYENIVTKNAPFSKYGNGAIELNINNS